MNTRFWRKPFEIILAVLLLTSIVLLANSGAMAQRRYQRRAVVLRPIDRSIDSFRPIREAQPIRPFSTFGPFGRPYHPYFDPYGRYDSYTFYRHSIGRSHKVGPR
jgi:hypothetical protein